MINPVPRAMQPRPPYTVEMFSSGPPRRPYIDVAYLEAEQDSAYSVDGTSEFIARLREQAGRMGCDGVVLGGVTNAPDAVASVTADINASRKGLTATCIMYVQDEVAGAPAAAPPPPPAAPLPPAPPAMATAPAVPTP